MLHSYLQTVIYTAVFCSLAAILTPKGRVKTAVCFACGITMLFSAVSPLVELDFESYSASISKYKLDAEKFSNAGAENSNNLNRTYIEEQCEAYILDKANELGAELGSVRVVAEWSDDGFWYPVSAEISYSCGEDKRNKLISIIESGLGIKVLNQKWSITNENG